MKYILFILKDYIYIKEEFEKSIEYFLRAISIDSIFAPSYAYIALAKIWTINRAVHLTILTPSGKQKNLQKINSS